MNNQNKGHPLKKARPLVKKGITAALLFTDIIAMAISFTLALYTAQFLKDAILPDVYNKPFSDYTNIHDLFFTWIYPIVLLTFYTKGHYTQRVPWWNQVHNVLKICLIAFTVDAFTRLAFDMSFSRTLIVLSWAYIFLFILLGRQIVYRLTRNKEDAWNIPTIIIGDVATVTDALHAFATDRYTGYKVKTINIRDKQGKEFDFENAPKQYHNISIENDISDYQTYIRRNIDHFFVVTLENFRGKDRDDIINTLTKEQALYAIVPPVSRVSLFEMEPRYFFGYDIMLLHAKYSIHSIRGSLVKRLMDVIIAGTALIPASIIIAIAGIMLKVEGQGGSIFYGGHRIGKNGKKFRCWKLRSMEPDSDHLLDELLAKDPKAREEWETYHKLKQPDPRITTKTAAIIRKYSIDELPQLWNVICGEMSIVGPRPILEREIEEAGISIQDYYRVHPGITGLWQVSGRNDTTFERRMYCDGWYVRNWSLWGDIVIIFKTVRVLLKRDGTY